MVDPTQKVQVFYHGKNAFLFKQKMEDYRKKHNLSDIFSPKIRVEDSGRKGAGVDPNKYIVTYYEFSAIQLRPENPIRKVIVRARTKGYAQEAFYRLTKDNPDVAFIRAIKQDKVPDTNLYEFVVEWRKAIYRKPKLKKRD